MWLRLTWLASLPFPDCNDRDRNGLIFHPVHQTVPRRPQLDIGVMRKPVQGIARNARL
jgi:hypothetical protein